MQPTQRLMLGNYIGALKNWVTLQETHDCLFCVVDLHALTVRPNPAELRNRTLDNSALYIAAGINPDKSTIFIQSNVAEHTQLSWVLSTFTAMGECFKMTQFKEKSEQHSETVGLFTYPILMAADILLYQTNLVPVGDDQKQHLELARNLAERFNHYYPNSFAIPEPYIPPVGARIMSLQDPTKKMSKSDSNEKATIYLTDEPDTILKKVKRSVTDSGTEIRYDKNRPALANLLTLYHISTGKPMPEIELNFEGKGYGALKAELADAIIDLLRPIQEKFNNIRADEQYLLSILGAGADSAGIRAKQTLGNIYKNLGLVATL